MLEILFYKSLPSTQKFLVEQIKKRELSSPIAIVADDQIDGIGSRENSWCGGEGNLYLSFALTTQDLPSDLPLTSYSIYFGTLFQMTLASMGSKIWVKWPNDLYIGDKKVGGVITTLFGKNIVCGVGCNLQNAPDYAAVIDLEIDRNILVNSYLKMVEKRISWKEVFSIFSVQFDQSKGHIVHSNDGSVSMKNAELCADGTIILNSQRMASNR
jgi:BirA family biotin operon repressor/biotin-[acetyl-CoA-carboxylase] ligase